MVDPLVISVLAIPPLSRTVAVGRLCPSPPSKGVGGYCTYPEFHARRDDASADARRPPRNGPVALPDASCPDRPRDPLDRPAGSFRRRTLLCLAGLLVGARPFVLAGEEAAARAFAIGVANNDSNAAKVSAEALVPVVRIRASLLRARVELGTEGSTSTLSAKAMKSLSRSLEGVPKDEVRFKQLFNLYSDHVLYEQKFLVHFSDGFGDVLKTPNMQEGKLPTKVLQSEMRDDAWTAMYALLLKIRSPKNGDGKPTVQEVLALLNQAITALDGFLDLAAPSDLKKSSRNCDKHRDLAMC